MDLCRQLGKARIYARQDGNKQWALAEWMTALHLFKQLGMEMQSRAVIKAMAAYPSTRTSPPHSCDCLGTLKAMVRRACAIYIVALLEHYGGYTKGLREKKIDSLFMTYYLSIIK